MANRFEDDEPAPGTVTPSSRNRFDDDPLPPAQRIAKEQSEMGWPAWLRQGGEDFLHSTGKMFSFGMGPRMDAGLDVARGIHPDYSTALAARLKESEERRERSQVASIYGDIAGGFATGGAAGATRLGANLAGRLGAGPVGRFFGFGAEGAALGGAQGAGQTYSGEAGDIAKNALIGGGVGGVIGGTAGATLVPRSAVQMRPGDPRTGQPIREPSEAQLEAISRRGYQELARIPVTYPNAFKQSALDAAEAQLQAANIPRDMARSVYRIIRTARRDGADISPAQIDAIRQQLNGVVNFPSFGSEKAGNAATILRNALDNMIVTGARHASDPALAQRAAQVVEVARANAASRFRSLDLTEPLANARLGATTQGTDPAKEIVRKGNKMLEQEGSRFPNALGWNAPNRDALAAAITPTPAERVASGFAKLPLPTIGAGAGALAGGTTGGVGAIAGGPAAIATGAGIGTGVGATLGGAAGLGIRRGLEGFSSRGIQRRWEELAAAQRANSPAFRRATQGAVPVAGPGMGPGMQGTVGGTTGVLGTPYTDERDALAWQAVQGLMQ